MRSRIERTAPVLSVAASSGTLAGGGAGGAPSRFSNTLLEAFALPRRVIEPKQVLDISVGDQTPIGPACNVGNDVLRARDLRGGAVRTAGEEPPPRWRFGRTAGVERSRDDDSADFRHPARFAVTDI